MLTFFSSTSSEKQEIAHKISAFKPYVAVSTRIDMYMYNACRMQVIIIIIIIIIIITWFI